MQEWLGTREGEQRWRCLHREPSPGQAHFAAGLRLRADARRLGNPRGLPALRRGGLCPRFAVSGRARWTPVEARSARTRWPDDLVTRRRCPVTGRRGTFPVRARCVAGRSERAYRAARGVPRVRGERRVAHGGAHARVDAVGRSLAADVRFDDPTVSRRHALIVRQPDGVRVLDDRSLNGVFVNGARIEGQTLKDGDEILVGRYRLSFLSVACDEESAYAAWHRRRGAAPRSIAREWRRMTDDDDRSPCSPRRGAPARPPPCARSPTRCAART